MEKEREGETKIVRGKICPRPTPDFASTQIAFFQFLKQKLNPNNFTSKSSLLLETCRNLIYTNYG